MVSLPIACSLSSVELDERRAVLAALRVRCRESRRLPAGTGLLLRFDPAPGVLADLARVVELERECCRFLQFRLDVAADGGPILLELAGPSGTTDFLEHELSLADVTPRESA